MNIQYPSSLIRQDLFLKIKKLNPDDFPVLFYFKFLPLNIGNTNGSLNTLNLNY